MAASSMGITFLAIVALGGVLLLAAIITVVVLMASSRSRHDRD